MQEADSPVQIRSSELPVDEIRRAIHALSINTIIRQNGVLKRDPRPC